MFIGKVISSDIEEVDGKYYRVEEKQSFNGDTQTTKTLVTHEDIEKDITMLQNQKQTIEDRLAFRLAEADKVPAQQV